MAEVSGSHWKSAVLFRRKKSDQENLVGNRQVARS